MEWPKDEMRDPSRWKKVPTITHLPPLLRIHIFLRALFFFSHKHIETTGQGQCHLG